MWTHVDTSWWPPGVAEPVEGKRGSLPYSLSPSTSPSSSSVWLLLYRSAARWPPQDGFSWLCQSCCHLFALCWSQQSGSASNPEQLGERLPSLAVPLTPLLCCNSSSLGSESSCHLLSAGQPLLSPTTPPLAPSSHLQVSLALSPMARLQKGAQAGTFIAVLSTLPAHYPQPRLSTPFPFPTSRRIPQLTAPQSLPQDSRQEN